MQFALSYYAPGETLLARMPNESRCDTDLASVTVRRELSDGSFRVAVVSSGGQLPSVQDESKRFAAGAAQDMQSTEDWIGVLELADIRLRGDASLLRFSFLTEDLRPALEACIPQMAALLLAKSLPSLLGLDFILTAPDVET